MPYHVYSTRCAECAEADNTHAWARRVLSDERLAHLNLAEAFDRLDRIAEPYSEGSDNRLTAEERIGSARLIYDAWRSGWEWDPYLDIVVEGIYVTVHPSPDGALVTVGDVARHLLALPPMQDADLDELRGN